MLFTQVADYIAWLPIQPPGTCLEPISAFPHTEQPLTPTYIFPLPPPITPFLLEPLTQSSA